MDEKLKFRINIIDFIPDHGKHPIGIDKNGEALHLGDMVRYSGEENWFIMYRYGDVVLKQPGIMLMIGIQDWSIVEKVNAFGVAMDWLVIGYDDEPLYEKVKHLIHQ